MKVKCPFCGRLALVRDKPLVCTGCSNIKWWPTTFGVLPTIHSRFNAQDNAPTDHHGADAGTQMAEA